MLAVEMHVAQHGDEDLETTSFLGLFIWRHNILYREVMVSGLRSRFDWVLWEIIMMRLTLRLFSGFSHEKSIEDVFKRWRRLAKRGSENGKVTMDRLFACQRAASLKSYPNVEQLPVELDSKAWDTLEETTRAEITRTTNIPLTPGSKANVQLAKQAYHGSAVAFPTTKLSQPKASDPTCSAFEHSHQAVYEFVLSTMEIDRETLTLTPESLGILQKTWVAGLVPNLHSDTRPGKPPCVLYCPATERAWVVVTHFTRAVAVWDLDQLEDAEGRVEPL